MLEISHLSGNRDWINLGLVECERTSEKVMVLGIQSVVGFLLLNTVELLVSLGLQCSRKTIHNWVQKTDL